MGGDDKKNNKEYEKPKIIKYDLDIEEVVMAKCKTGVNAMYGPTSKKCQRGKVTCKDIASA